jgi:hypothetical protein
MKVVLAVTCALVLFTIDVNASDLATEADKCFALSPMKNPDCQSRSSLECTDEKGRVATISCLKKLGFKDGCRVFAHGIGCDIPTTQKFFPQTKNCELHIENGTDEWTIAELKTSGDLTTLDLEKTCKFVGFNLKADASINARGAVRQKNGTWISPKPTISFALDKIFPASSIEIVTTAIYRSQPWFDLGESACEGDAIVANEFISVEDRDKNLKRLNFFGIKGLMPERHYVGRKGPKNFPIIDRFDSKKLVKLCGVQLPPTKGLWVGLSTPNCRAMVDGALTIGGLPPELFPSLKVSSAKDKADAEPTIKNPLVACTPKAGRKSRVDDLIIRSSDSRKPEPLPVLDWQDCDCALYDPNRSSS